MLWKFLRRWFFGVPPEKDEGKGDAIWCVVANVMDEHPFGESRETRRGTKYFYPGAKVYCYPPLWGDGYEKIKVIGHRRRSHKLVTIVMPSKWLENWRVKMVYSPQIIKRMDEHWDASQKSHYLASQLVESLKVRPTK